MSTLQCRTRPNNVVGQNSKQQNGDPYPTEEITLNYACYIK